MFSLFRRRGRSAVLFLAHRIDDSTMTAWRHLKGTCGRDVEVFFVYDDTRSDFPGHADIAGSELYRFSFAEVARRWPVRIWDPARPFDQGNIVFVVLSFREDRPGFDFYWKLEFDVLLDGAWEGLFGAFARDPSDLLTTTLARPEVRPGWVWWPTLGAPATVRRAVDPIRSFMPLARLSRGACDALGRAYRDGWAGHDEVSVPTILHHAGLTVADLGGSGAFVPRGAEHRWYTNSPASEGLAPGTFVCPPQRASPHDRRGKIYHPVKDRAAFLSELGSVRGTARPD